MKRLTTLVAITSYNGDEFIRQQIESILNQKVLPEEIVVSDDGSTDNTVEIVKDIADIAEMLNLLYLRIIQNMAYPVILNGV